MFRVGDFVILKSIPPDVGAKDDECHEVFKLCVGRTMRVEDITEQGLLSLECGPDIDGIVGGFGNSVYVEPEYISPAPKEDS